MAFRAWYDLFESLVMPFGLTNAPASFQDFTNDGLWPRPAPSYPRGASTPVQPRLGSRNRFADSLRPTGEHSSLRTRPSRSLHLLPSRENSEALARHPPARCSGCSRGRHHQTPSLMRRPKTAPAPAVVPGPHNTYSLSVRCWQRRGMTSPPATPMTDPNQPAPLSLPPLDIRFDVTRIPALTSFLRRTGLGFVRDVRNRLAKDDSEVDNLNAGPIGRLSLDLDF